MIQSLLYLVSVPINLDTCFFLGMMTRELRTLDSMCKPCSHPLTLQASKHTIWLRERQNSLDIWTVSKLLWRKPHTRFVPPATSEAPFARRVLSANWMFANLKLHFHTRNVLLMNVLSTTTVQRLVVVTMDSVLRSLALVNIVTKTAIARAVFAAVCADALDLVDCLTTCVSVPSTATANLAVAKVSANVFVKRSLLMVLGVTSRVIVSQDTVIWH
mmetsp:Transcript_26946/g.41321  ORF Transcript_26946/g.41321 Transcript_26946/m.41321 type:complete len:216 (+) Transcript_26946:537-1184(+)